MKKALILGVVFSIIMGVNIAGALPKVDSIIRKLDIIMDLKSDFSAKISMIQVKKGQGKKLIEGFYYRRDSDDSFLMIMTEPSSEKGNGYLKIGDNMWMYRRNTRTFQHISRDESVSGTDMKAGDMEKRKMSELFKPQLKGGKEVIEEAKLGKIACYKFTIVNKVPDVTYPTQTIWVRKDNFLPLKEMLYSGSGDLMATSYHRKYVIINGKYFNKESIYIDEFEKGNRTVMNIDKISLKKIEASVFTKPYLENLSR